MTAEFEEHIDLLLVEDNPDDARFVERLLHEYQSALEDDGLVTVTTFEHVDRLADALERVQDAPPDVVLLDLNLPDSGGLETVERVVEHAPSVPVVVLTGQNDEQIGLEAIQCGAQDYLVKGTITAELIRRTVRYAIERKRNQRELRDRNHRLALLNRIVRQDIRDDVSMIVGWGDHLRAQVEPDMVHAADALLEATEHVIELTDTAADLMDAISVAGESAGEPVDVRALLEAEVEQVRHSDDVEISIDGPDDQREPLTVVGSPMLATVFDHLLTNAIRHTDRDRPSIEIEIEATETTVSIAIADDGVGIPDSQKALLTDPDGRLDERSGMGVGLYLVTTVLDQLGARFEIEDNTPRGAVVTVTLERHRPN